jgi:DNA-binding CsgD family transcriptional regulator
MPDCLSSMVPLAAESGIRPVPRPTPLPVAATGRRERRSGRGSRRAVDGTLPDPHLRGNPTVHFVALAALDKLNRGVVLLDESGVILEMNRAARAMAESSHGLCIRNERLEFCRRSAADHYRHFLCNGGDKSEERSLVLRIEVPRGRGACRVLVSRLDPDPLSGSEAGFVVFIYEPAGGPKLLPDALLRQLYGMTPAEARLANRLFAGDSLAGAAATLGVSINTAKATLKRVFERCEVRSQTELVQLLSLGPRTL